MYGLLYFKAESAKKSPLFHNNSECGITQFCNPNIAKYNPQVTGVVCVCYVYLLCWYGELVWCVLFCVFISCACCSRS